MAGEQARSMGMIDVSLQMDKSDESLLKLWKMTSQGGLICKYMSTERVNYRSWRLVNRNVLGGVVKFNGTSKVSLDDLARDSLSELRPNSSQFLTKDRSHLSNNSSTLFSHSSRLSLDEQKNKINSINGDNSSDDTSDISEDDEDDDLYSSDGCADVEFNKQSNPATRKADIDQKLKSLAFSKKCVNNIEAAVATQTNGGPDKGKDHNGSKATCAEDFCSDGSFVDNKCDNRRVSLAVPSNKLANSNQKPITNKNIFYIENSPSPPKVGEQGSKKNGSEKADRSGSLTDLNNEPPAGRIKRADSLFSSILQQSKQLNSDDYEEDVEDGYSSTDISEDEEDVDEGIEDGMQNIKNDDQTNVTNSKFGKSFDSGRAEDNDSEWQSISEEEDRSEPALQPLKFSRQMDISLSHGSSSTDTFLQARSNGQTYPPSIKPRSLLSGLFLNELAREPNTSSPTVSKPILKRSSTTGVITVNQEQPDNRGSSVKQPSILFSKRHASLTDISKNYPHHHNQLMRDYFLEEVQGIPETANNDGLWKRSSSVGISEFNVTTKSSSTLTGNSHTVKSEEAARGVDGRLSGSMSSSSFKHILSKSSLNLSTLLNTSKSKFTRRNDSSEKLQSLKKSLNSVSSIHLKASEVDSSETNSPKFSSSYSAISASSFITSSKLPSESAPKSFRLSPKTTRRAMLSSELSQSLKESILIDYRLGKVPLPQKVINSEELMRAIGAKGSDIDESDDYHSKGW